MAVSRRGWLMWWERFSTPDGRVAVRMERQKRHAAPIQLGLYADQARAYNPAHETLFCDHYSNYLPGALKHEPPGQGVWNTAPPLIQRQTETKDATNVRRDPRL